MICTCPEAKKKPYAAKFEQKMAAYKAAMEKVRDKQEKSEHRERSSADCDECGGRGVLWTLCAEFLSLHRVAFGANGTARAYVRRTCYRVVDDNFLSTHR